MLKSEFMLLRSGDRVLISIRGKNVSGIVVKVDKESSMIYTRPSTLSRVIRRHYRTVYREFV